MYKKDGTSFWTAEEMNLSKEVHDWTNCMNDNERHFIFHILAFFTPPDDLLERFSNEVQIAEAQCFYGFWQIMMKSIHSETYSLPIDTCIKDTTQCEYLFGAIENIPCIKCKAEWPWGGSLTSDLLFLNAWLPLLLPSVFSPLDPSLLIFKQDRDTDPPFLCLP